MIYLTLTIIGGIIAAATVLWLAWLAYLGICYWIIKYNNSLPEIDEKGNIMRYKCKFCGENFAKKRKLKKHLKIHKF